MNDDPNKLQVGDTILQPVLGDIRTVAAEAFVRSTKTMAVGQPVKVSSRQWVSGADTEAGGAISQALTSYVRHTPLRLGDVIVTPAGALPKPAKYMFHAVVIDQSGLQGDGPMNDAAVIAAARKCIAIAAALGLKSIAFTPWGTKLGYMEASVATAIMLNAITAELGHNPGDLHTIYLVSHNKEHYRWFVDRTYVFELLRDQIGEVRQLITGLDIPDAVRSQILDRLDDTQRVVINYIGGDVVGGDKIDVGNVQGSGIAVGRDASASSAGEPQ